MSTRWTVVTCAEVRLLNDHVLGDLDAACCSSVRCAYVACSARGMGVKARPLAQRVGSRRGCGRGGAEQQRQVTGCGPGRLGGGARAVAPCAIYASTSCLVMRPPAPVPLNLLEIDVVLARHVANQRRQRAGRFFCGFRAGSAAGGGAGPAATWSRGVARRLVPVRRSRRLRRSGWASAAGARGCAAPAAAPSSIRATTVLIATVFPSSHQYFAQASRQRATEFPYPPYRLKSQRAVRPAPLSHRASSATSSACLLQCFRPSGALRRQSLNFLP